MSKKTVAKEGYVRKETLLIVSAIALIIGFLGGVVFTVHKTGSGQSGQIARQKQTAQETQNISNKVAAQIFELEKRTLDNPEDVESWIQLGHLYFDTNDYDKAILAYKKSLALKPENPDVLTDMGVMYRRIGNPSEAVKSFDRAIELDPNHEIARYNKGIVFMHDLNNIEEAVKAWEELIAMNPDAKAPGGQSLKEMVQRFKSMPDTGGN